MPKTIAIDARKIKSSTGRYVLELIKNLEQLDHTNHYKILVLAGEADYYKPTQANFEVIVADFAHYSFAEQLGFGLFLYKLKADLVHFYMPQQPLLYIRPAVTTVHDLNLLHVTENDMSKAELSFKKKVFAGLLRIVAHRARRIITPNNFTKDELVQWAHIDPQKVSVTHEGVYDTISKTKPTPGYRGVPFLVYLGRAEPYKNNRRMIEAHQRLIRTNPELRLVIIGAIDDLRQADIDWVKACGYKNIDFTGWLADEQAAWLYQNAIAYVGPSYLEGFGLPALEAMSYGAPVVSANTTCSPEILGNAAHYFDPFSVDDMTRAISDVMTNPSLRSRLIKQGHSQVKKYSWRRMAEQTLAIYQKSLATPANRVTPVRQKKADAGE